jgi:hypothetical protein
MISFELIFILILRFGVLSAWRKRATRPGVRGSVSTAEVATLFRQALLVGGADRSQEHLPQLSGAAVVVGGVAFDG